jgi:uncharacterized Zn finger protein
LNEGGKLEGMMKERDLYQCPACGHIDHDEQDGTGHWEQGTCSDEHYEATGWSYWTLACSKCGAVNDMPLVKSSM